MHQLGRWPDNCKEDAWPRSELGAPFVIRDTLPGGVNGLYHHGVAKRTDSKSQFRRLTKESGCIEVGNEMAATRSRPFVDNIKSETIEAAVNDALHRQGVSSESDVGDFIV
jgi:hypothetical protein